MVLPSSVAAQIQEARHEGRRLPCFGAPPSSEAADLAPPGPSDVRVKIGGCGQCLFVYGTLLDPALVFDLTGRVASMRPATLAGWRRVRLRGTPFPTLVRGRDGVPGAVVMVDAVALRRLHRYEGPRYRLIAVKPLVAGRPVRARTWVAAGGTPRSWS
jgi:hypothetical protein